MRRIDAVDVEARVRFGIAEALRLGEDLGEVAALGFHLGQDEIAGAVEDAVDAGDLVGGGAFAQPLDHRHAARHRGFELERQAGILGGGGELQAMMRDHRLVGGDQALAAVQRRAGQGEGGAVRAADQLDHHVRPGMARQRGGIVDPVEARDVDAAILGPVARGDGDHFDRPAGAAGDQRRIRVDQADHARADGAQACKCDTKRFGHCQLIPRHAELVSASNAQQGPRCRHLAAPWTLKQVQGDGGFLCSGLTS